MARRLLALSTSVAAAGLGLALLPALAANAAGSVSVSVDPTHGVPGTSLDVTITVSGCSPDVVTLTGTYVDTNGDDATITPVEATNDGEGGWHATTAIPADAARTSLTDEPLRLTATPDSSCDTSASPTPSPTASPTTPPAALRRASAKAAAAPAAVPTGSANVVIDGLAAATLTVDPTSVKAGSAFDYSITGCVDGVADFYLEDNDGNDYDIPESSITSQPSKDAYKGTFTVPANAVTGDAGVFLECTQAESADAALVITDGTAGSGGGVPVPVTGRPRFTG